MKFRKLAAVAALCLFLLYACSLIFALMDSPLSQNLLMASVYCSIAVPVGLYAFVLLIRHLKNRK
ncbi:hypothetical protein [Otoolea muris]|uniref:hypothetical protein n=1 Tax=Otoolea muris TaxID=2941515 RepID=UPI002040F304|nr:hypothetical protein [Otoolea muris]